MTFREGSATRLTTTRDYDLLDRLTGVSSVPSASSVVSFAYAYDLLNQRTGLTNADNSFWTFGYDSKGQVQSGKRYWSDQSLVAGQQFEYQFDDIGNRKQAKSGGDAQGQSLRATSYTLKPNRLNQYDTRTLPGFADVLGEATNTASVNVNGQMAGRKGSYYRVELALTNTSAASWLGITNVAVLNQGTNADIIATNIGSLFVPASPESFTYDADGNLTGDGRWSYTWDAENRLVKMESLASAPAGSKRRLTFEYDWRWRRVRLGASTWTNNQWSVTVSNKFAYDGWNLLGEFNATNNAVIRSYLWGLDLSGTMRGAAGAGGLLAIRDQSTINGQPSTHFTCFDGNGNVIGLVNAADGKVSARYEYGPFGELLRATGPMAAANPFRFSTKYQDDETGFLYYGFRYYRADLGRWLNQDPIGEMGGLNLYGFVGNQPLDLVDLLGLADKPGDIGWGRSSGGTGGSAATTSTPRREEYLSCNCRSATCSSCGQKTYLGPEVPYTMTSPNSTEQLFNSYLFYGIGASHIAYQPNATEWRERIYLEIMTTPGFALGGELLGTGLSTTKYWLWADTPMSWNGACMVRTVCTELKHAPFSPTLIGASSAAAENGVPAALRAGQLAEGPALDAIGSSGKVVFTPTAEQIDCAAFKVIVGDAKYTPSGAPVSTIFDGTIAGGFAEVKSGASALSSAYQLRLQTYGALTSEEWFGRPMTLNLFTDRPINPTFSDWLTRWGVSTMPMP